MATKTTEPVIAYGGDQLQLSLPGSASILKVQEPEKEITHTDFTKSLRSYLDSSPRDLTKTVVVVADKTRLCGYSEYLPLLIEELLRAGMNVENLKIIIAYGTHSPQTEEECLLAYGNMYKRCNFTHHNCNDRSIFIEMGTTSRGTPIRLRKDLIEATTIITMGAICHHYFAGYGGGRKLIFPGCGEKKAIYANHRLYLDTERNILAPGCQPGNITSNPLAEDLFEIEKKLPAHIAIHGILDSQGTLCELHIGSGSKTFEKACSRHGENCEVSSKCFETVIASCGGYPKDINFIQTHKAIHNAAMFVADGGLLLLYSECRDGIGSKTFLPWFDSGSFKAAFSQLVQNYEGNGGTALAMMTKLQRIRIGLITSISEDICKKIGVEKWQHPQVIHYLSSLPDNHLLGCIPNASLLVNVNRC